MAAYLEACLEEADGDAAFVAKALGDIARAKGMSQVARDAGLSRESLYKALSGERSPDFDTVLRVMAALGLRLHAETTQSNPTGTDDLLLRMSRRQARRRSASTMRLSACWPASSWSARPSTPTGSVARSRGGWPRLMRARR